MERELNGIAKRAVNWVCALFAIFEIYTATFGSLPDIQQPAMYIMLGLTITFGLWHATNGKPRKKKIPLYDIVFIVAAIICTANTVIHHSEIMLNPAGYTSSDIVFSALLVLLVMEAARRTIGWMLPLLAILTIGYSLITDSSISFILGYLYSGDQGIFGTLTDIGTNIISIFMIFGAFLLYSGGGQTFIDIASKASGNIKGGPAKIAVIASALFGMLSGSAVANAATVGNFTIPLMKKAGYKPEMAAAIEAVGSTGGIFVPPIMGAAAFVMSDLLNISYVSVMCAAIIPATLYYAALFFYVHFTAIKEGLEASGPEPDSGSVLTWEKMGPLALPLIGFVVALVMGFTPTFSGVIASMLCILAFILKDLKPAGIFGRARGIGGLLSVAGRAVAYVMPLMVCAQIVVSMLGESGLANSMSTAIMGLGESYKIMGLVMTAILALILGMGVPPVGAYVLTVAIASPALIGLGIQEVPAHFFILSFSTFGAITPPVCAAVFVASAIAESSWLKTGIAAVKIAVVAMILPFAYTLFKPYLLGMGSAWEVAYNFLFACIATICMSSAFTGAFFKGPIGWPQRIAFGIGAFLTLVPFYWPYRMIGIMIILFSISISMWKLESRVANLIK